MLDKVVSWDRESPSSFVYEDHRSRVLGRKDYGSNLVVPIGGVAMKVYGGPRSFFCYQSLPGLIPMYFVIDGSTIHCSHSMFAMRELVAERGLKIKDIMQCKEGVAYHFSGKGLRRYVVDTWNWHLHTTLTLEKAGDRLLELLVQAAEPLKGKKVLTLISGGTDGILTAYALKLAGVEQHCVCVGRTEEDFDPKFARKYAEKLGLSYEMLTLPESNEDLQALLEDALRSIEMADFSNVLMGMCNVMIAQWAKERGFEAVANADLADVILGNDILTTGVFNKKHDRQGTAKQWAEYRISDQLRTLPTSLQIFKAFEFNDLPVYQLFGDREVIEFMLGLSMEVTPSQHIKPLYYEILNRALPENSWGETGKKVGYYTGSGIGAIRLENPVLKDSNIRSTFQSICP